LELIIKPTELCNFACTFCSSPNLSDKHTNTLDLKYIENFLTKYPETNTIIVNGGDPLMLSPTYYFDILNIIKEKNLDTTLSFTSNLWDFYKTPDKWTPLFQKENVGVTTSFNYGDTRRISKNRVYTEEDFWKISDLFLERIGYRPDFISVITNENLDTAFDNVLLAKKMGVQNKLNYVFNSGYSKEVFYLADIYKIYIKIYEEGLSEYEYNTDQIFKMKSKLTTCPLSKVCDSNIRTLHPDGKLYSCGAFADDGKYEIPHSEYKEAPLKKDFNLKVLKADCFACELFDICNGCHKKISDIKQSDSIEKHCNKMQKIKENLVKHLK